MFKAAKLLCNTLTLSLVLIGCSGGGGKKGGVVDLLQILVKQVSPTNNASGYDARNAKVKVTFNFPVDPKYFINSSASVSTLLQKSGYQAYTMDTKTPAGNVTLEQLSSGKYYIGRKHGGQIVLNTPEWSFREEGGGQSGLEIRIPETGENFYYNSKELQASKLTKTENTSFSLTNSSGTAVEGTLEIDSTSKIVTFTALQLLKWNETYTVRIKAGVTELNGGRKLHEDYVSKFKTTNISEPAIDNATPVGIDASPIKAISFDTNFKVDSSDLGDKVVLEKVDLDGTGAEVGTTPLETTQSVSSIGTKVTITPAQELDYLTKYRVTVFGGPDGISCTISSPLINPGPGGCLRDTYVWEFTTALPRVHSFTPTVSNPNSPVVAVETMPEIEFNFRPDLNSALSKISLTKNGGTPVDFTASLAGTSRVVISPNDRFNLLDYDTKYTVTVAKGVVSADREGIVTASDFSASFTTEQRKIISRDPEMNTKSFNPDNGVIKVQFNFDPSVTQLQNRNFFAVNKRETGDGGWIAVDGSVTYSPSTRTVTFNPSAIFDFNTRFQVIVSGNLQEDCGTAACPKIAAGSYWEFEAIISALTIASSSPSNNATAVRLDKTLELNFNHSLDPNTVNSNSVSVTSTCQVPNLTLSWNENTIFVQPSGNWKSFCQYTAIVDSGLRGSRDQRISSTQSLTFKTDGLKVVGVFATIAYSNYVDVDSDIVVEFNYDVGCCATGNWLQVYDDFGNPVFGSIFRSGKTLRFNPTSSGTGGVTSYLKFGMGYDVYIDSNYVVGVNGEELAENYATSFLTENLPIDILDYGPTGFDVFIDDDFWVEVATPYNGFSNRTEDPAFPDVFGEILENGFWDIASDLEMLGSEIFIEPDFLLEYDTDYTVEFDFNYDYGGTWDDFLWDWDVRTEVPEMIEQSKTAVSKAMAVGGANADKPMVKSVLGKGARKPMPERRRSSCATTKISGCMAKVNEHRAKIGEKQSLAKKERRNLEVVATPYEASYYTKYFHPARTMKEQAMAKDLPLRQERRQKHLAEREKRKASGGLKRTRSAR